MQKKLVLMLCVVSLLPAAVYYIPRGYQQTIVIGMYAECPLEAAEEIAVFRAEHPNASLRITNDITKADYNEWLARVFLTGSEPDIFVIPPEDFEKYIQLGAVRIGCSSFSPDMEMTAAQNPDGSCVLVIMHNSPERKMNSCV